MLELSCCALPCVWLVVSCDMYVPKSQIDDHLYFQGDDHEFLFKKPRKKIATNGLTRSHFSFSYSRSCSHLMNGFSHHLLNNLTSHEACMRNSFGINGAKLRLQILSKI